MTERRYIPSGLQSDPPDKKKADQQPKKTSFYGENHKEDGCGLLEIGIAASILDGDDDDFF